MQPKGVGNGNRRSSSKYLERHTAEMAIILSYELTCARGNLAAAGHLLWVSNCI